LSEVCQPTAEGTPNASCDFYSHYPEIRIMKQKSSEDVVMALKSIFAAHGILQEIVADNMPFNSYVMGQFASLWVSRSPRPALKV
jgi:hypothetical protein